MDGAHISTSLSKSSHTVQLETQEPARQQNTQQRIPAPRQDCKLSLKLAHVIAHCAYPELLKSTTAVCESCFPT
eukprot:1954187-Amphidinium_carterae.1